MRTNWIEPEIVSAKAGSGGKRGNDMKFGFRGSRRPSEEVANLEDWSQPSGTESPQPGRGRWSTAFLVMSSALLGATAIAFWNRRTIATMRAQIQDRSERPLPTSLPEDDIY